MNKKKLFGMMTSWLLVIVMLAGCVVAPQIDIPGGIILENPTVSTPSSSVVVTPPESNTSTPPSSGVPIQPGTSVPIQTVPPTTTVPPTGTPTVPPTTVPGTSSPAVPPTTPPATPVEPTPNGSSFEIHFIDVGQADAALVICDGETMLIDGGNAADSNLMYAYLEKHNITHLNYVIGTHAHEDHIGGIPGALRFATVDTVYCPSKNYSTKAFQNFLSAVRNQGKNLTVPTVGTTFNLGSATCTILAVNTDSKDMNNTSIVMRIVYGENSFLFTGDAEDVVEKALLDKGVTLKSDVLKVGHHGSNSSTTYSFLREVMPRYAVICVGADNDYGHPTSNVLSRLRDADVTTFRTDKHGDVICKSDGKNITFTPSKNADINPYVKIGPNSTQQS